MASRRHEVRKIQDGKPHYLSNYDSSFVVFMFLTSIKAHCQSIRNQSTSICISDSVTPYERRPFPLSQARAWMAFQRPLWAHALPPPMYTILGTYHKKLSDRQMCFWGKCNGNAWIPRSTLLLHSSQLRSHLLSPRWDLAFIPPPQRNDNVSRKNTVRLHNQVLSHSPSTHPQPHLCSLLTPKG